MQGSPRHNTPTCEHPTSRTSEKPDTKWTHSRSSTTDSYCQMHKILSRPSDCWVDWAWLDQIWRNFFFLFRSKALGHITSKNLNNMICIWFENAQAIKLNKYYLISLSTIRLFGITSMIVQFLFWIPTWTFSWRIWDSTVSMSSSSTTGTKWTYNSSSSSCRDHLVTTLPHASIQILEPVGNQIQSERTQDHLRQIPTAKCTRA